MSSSNQFPKIHFDFAPCRLQTKAPLAQKVKPFRGEGHLPPTLKTPSVKGPFISRFPGKPKGDELAT